MSLGDPRTLICLATALLLNICLAGCDSGDTPVVRATITITPSLGIVRNATIDVKNPAGVSVGRGATDNTGIARVLVTGTGPFVIEVQGDSDADYFDEAANIFLAFPESRVLRAIVPSGSTNVGVTGLTDVAHALWAADGAPLSDANINAANNAVLAAFTAGSGLTSILTPPNPLSSNPSGTLSSSDADIYAAILAGLADLGLLAPVGTPPALTVIEQLRRDVEDGSIDGMEIFAHINPLYDGAAFTTQLQTHIQNRFNTLGDASLQATALTISALIKPVWSGTGPGIVTGDVPAIPHAQLLDGDFLTFTRAPNVSAGVVPYTDGTDYYVQIHGDGRLAINGASVTSPIYRLVDGVVQRNKIIWIDRSGHSRGYVTHELVVSNNQTGIFDGISVTNPYPTSFVPEFIGQFTRATTPRAITSFTPSGSVGTTVKLFGKNLSNGDINNLKVLFAGNVDASITRIYFNEIDVIVPAGAIDGPITLVYNSGAPVVSASDFDVIEP